MLTAKKLKQDSPLEDLTQQDQVTQKLEVPRYAIIAINIYSSLKGLRNTDNPELHTTINHPNNNQTYFLVGRSYEVVDLKNPNELYTTSISSIDDITDSLENLRIGQLTVPREDKKTHTIHTSIQPNDEIIDIDQKDIQNTLNLDREAGETYLKRTPLTIEENAGLLRY